jgi:phosphonate transport system substrate-binding protein
VAPLTLGAVAYDPKVVTIWDGFRSWLRSRDFDLDFLLYSHYERQVDDLIDGRIDVAWNSPLAWVRAQRLAASRSVPVDAFLMRDTDRDIVSPADLRGRRVGVGAVDSPQATLLPLSRLRRADAVPDGEVIVQRFDVGVGLHGDHVGGEREAVAALLRGEVEAACLLDSNLLLFARESTLPAGSVRVIAQTDPFDHCNMTSGPSADASAVSAFAGLLLEMSYADASVRPLLDLEGLTQWLPGRTSGYELLERAVDESGFYGRSGEILAADYRP